MGRIVRHLAGAIGIAASLTGVARAACPPIGARYAPRSTNPSDGIRYRMTILPPPGDVAVVAERYRFELTDRRTGRLLSRVDLDTICGMGRLPCTTWPPGSDNDTPPFHSIVIRLNADFTPVRDWRAAHAILFPNFSEHDWATALALTPRPNVRYFTRPHVEPDLSDQTIWVRTACGPPAPAAGRSPHAPNGTTRR